MTTSQGNTIDYKISNLQLVMLFKEDQAALERRKEFVNNITDEKQRLEMQYHAIRNQELSRSDGILILYSRLMSFRNLLAESGKALDLPVSFSFTSIDHRIKVFYRECEKVSFATIPTSAMSQIYLLRCYDIPDAKHETTRILTYKNQSTDEKQNVLLNYISYFHSFINSIPEAVRLLPEDKPFTLTSRAR